MRRSRRRARDPGAMLNHCRLRHLRQFARDAGVPLFRRGSGNSDSNGDCCCRCLGLRPTRRFQYHSGLEKKRKRTSRCFGYVSFRVFLFSRIRTCLYKVTISFFLNYRGLILAVGRPFSLNVNPFASYVLKIGYFFLGNHLSDSIRRIL